MYHSRKEWALTLVGMLLLVMVPYSVNADYNDSTYVAETWRYLADTGNTGDGIPHDEYHPLLIQTPGFGYFTNTYDFSDTRTGGEGRKVIISICVETDCDEKLSMEYNAPYSVTGSAEKSFHFGSGLPDPETIYVDIKYEVFSKVNGDWILDTHASDDYGQSATVFKV